MSDESLTVDARRLRRRKSSQRWRLKNREKVAEYQRMYQVMHREQISLKTKLRHRVKRNKVASRPRPNLCEVCNKPPKNGTVLYYDHCHLFGHFRGWLCRSCNVVLGMVGDDPKVLDALAAYLRRNGDE